MRTRIAIMFASVLLLVMACAAQQANRNPSSSSLQISSKVLSVSGEVGADGKTLTANNSTIWTVANPDVLLDNIGDRVRIRAHADLRKHELQVISVQLDPKVGARLDDAAFRR